MFACRTSNGIKAPPGLVHELWFELGTDFHSLSSNSRSIWNTPFKKKEKKKKKEKRAQLVLIQTDLEIWISLDTIILSVSSHAAPRVGRQTSGLFAV